MAATLPPLKDTERLIEWDELPDTVRRLPDKFDPLAEGVLMRHQAQWLRIDAALKVCAKGRRTGITFAEALDDTLVAGAKRAAGGMDVFYIPDVKDKGLEFVGYAATFARVIAEAQGQGLSAIEQFLFDDQDEKGNTRKITAWRIRFASGFKIVALSSRPASLRGLQGKVVIDEAAFHGDVQAVLDAATALLIWGGRIAIISSHNGRANPFNQLILDIEKGLYGPTTDAAVFTATFDDAVGNGLYERVCFVNRWTPSAEGKKKWYTRIRTAYGPRKAAMREELDAIPRHGSGLALPGIWIDAAMAESRPVLRLVLDDDFTARPDSERRAWVEDWIARHLAPLLKQLDPERRHVFGQDFARHRDFSVIMPYEIAADRRRRVPFAVEMHKVPARQQEQILWALIDGLPRFGGGAMDATGSGQTLAEYTADKFGHSRIHQVNLSRAWYGQYMPKFIEGFEDGAIDLPRDDNLANDLRAIEEVDGIPMVQKARTADVKDPDLYRHGDAAVALCLGWYATLEIDKGPVITASRRPRQAGRITEGYA